MIFQKDATPAMFDRISRSYDRVNRVLSFFLDLRWRKTVARYLLKEKGSQILDLATGTGDQICALFKVHPSIASVVGVDLSEGMLQIARKKISKTSYAPKVDLLKGNAEALSLQDAQFDACTFSFGIRNVSDPSRVLKEIFRVIKPQGQCLILEFSVPPNVFRSLFLFYLRRCLPLIGGRLSKDPEAYRYLNQSIENLPPPCQFLEWMEKAGWKNARAIPLFFGALTLYTGVK